MLENIRKYFVASIFILTITNSLKGQAPSPYLGGTQVSYVRIWNAVAPEDNSGNLTTVTTSDRALMTTQYFDGLGRPIQTVAKGGSLITNGSQVDMVSAGFYDNRGREQYKYLPFAANATNNNTSVSDGMFKLNPFEQQFVFCQEQYSGETNFYAHTKLEASPLSRPLENYSAGTNWVGTENTSKHGIKNQYWTNTANDDVKIWNVNSTNVISNPSYNLQVSVTDIGGGQQNVTYSWSALSNAGTVMVQFRSLPSGTWNSWPGSPVGPRTITIATGSYEYAIQIYFNDGNPGSPQTILASLSPVSSYSVSGIYAAGSLYKTVTEDEQGKQVIEFKDKDGKIILKKVQLTATADDGITGSGYTDWLCTYYIYDDLNQLRCVLQPEGVKTLAANSWNLMGYSNGVLLTEQCFRYEYDQRERMIIKKVPGAEPEYLIYDARDRMVLTQTGNLRRQNQWFFTKYDVLDRPIFTGLYTNSTYLSQSSMQNYLTSQNLGFSETYNPSTYPLYSLNQSFPVVTINDVLTFNYYDDYTWTSYYGSSYGTKDNSFDASFPAPSSVYPYPQSLAQSFATRGMVTGTWDKTGSGLITSNLYDDKGRIVQSKKYNYGQGTDIVTTQYNWATQPLQTILRHQKTINNTQTHNITTKYDYDILGRLVDIKKSVNSNISGQNISKPEQMIVQNQYDALGQLKNKKLAPAYNSNAGLETENYDYNIRGWLLGMNRDYVKDVSSTNYFGFDLGYDKNGSLGIYIPQYNGNISGTIWKSKGDGAKRKYDFTYDAANRLTGADFNQWVSGSGTSATFDKSANINFSVSALTYDANGNILTMNQNGLKLYSSQLIDQLTYNYQSNSNKLAKITDAVSDANTKLGDFHDGTNGTADDYAYDANGDLSFDKNKNIGNITYNYLNLPSVITVTGKGTITYTYDVAGNKLQKQTTENNASVSYNGTNYTTNIITTTLYIAGFVYESKSYTNSSLSTLQYTDQLQFTVHEEGRIRFKSIDNSFQFDYFVKDHLGNVRMVLTEEQQTNYYPASTFEGTTNTGDKSMLNWEKQFYTIDNTKLVSSIPGWNSGLDYANNNGNPTPPPYNSIASGSYPSDYTVNEGATSIKMYQLNANSNKTGLGFVIKVMAGDVINIFGKSYYYAPNQTFDNTNSSSLVLNDILNTFLGTPGNPATGKGLSLSDMQNLNSGTYSIPSTFFRGNDGTSSATPKAYLNFIFFDDQFRYAGGGFSRVGNTGQLKSHWYVDPALQNLSVLKSGYLYVYVSNESNVNVYFDNIQIIHTRGPILEETHYYPFGLTMNGISSKALSFGTPQNKYKFNDGNELQSNEFSDGSGLESYDATNRMYDAQIGRFWQIDELAESNWEWTPYNFALDNPISFNDPLGLKEGDSTHPKVLPTVTIVTIPKDYWAQRRLYYDISHILDSKGATIAQIMQPSLANMMYHQDDDTKWESKIADMTRNDDKIALEIGSWFIPIPASELLKLRYLKFAAKLFRLKRGKALVKVTEEVLEHGDEVAKLYSEATYKAFEKQLAKDGMKSILKSRATIQKNLAEEIEAVAKYKAAGGYTSSVEREIKTFQSQLGAIEDLLKNQK